MLQVQRTAQCWERRCGTKLTALARSMPVGFSRAPVQKRQHMHRRQTTAVAASQASNDRPEAKVAWDRTTDALVGFSSIPFSILVLPQVVQNVMKMAAGNAQSLSVISWEGYLSGLLGNTLMCSHFANSGEQSAVTVQLIGIVNNMAVLLQVALAGFMPWVVFLGTAAAVALAVGISLARLQSLNRASAADSKASGMANWRTWQLVSGIAGLAVVPQVLYNVMVPATPTYLPGAICLLLLLLWFSIPANRQAQPGRLQVEQLPGVASTLLFALSPLPQLVRNFVGTASLEGLNVGTILLAVVGNALMVPRALWVRDAVWLTGTTWACCAGWGQLLSMFLRKSPLSGARYLEPSVFAAATVSLLVYSGYVLRKDKMAKAQS